ncbi:aminotransferase class V-fold PLP-dependent enzyme [Thermogladius sp.]|uniref:aminotransferase class V-fold PLP-dependent enzyme n=1 Tax=Thermogladius sp. TaxID=2023064 RepID=UPI003D0F24E9
MTTLKEKRVAGLLRDLYVLSSKTPRHESSILGSMTTPPDPLALHAFSVFSHTNLADIELFPPLKDMYREVLEFAAALYGSGKGYVTAGATESNIVALFVARELHGKGSSVVLAPDTVHLSVEKGCRLLGCKLVKVPTGNKPVDPGLLEDYVRVHKPFAIVVTAGTTELGLVDPLREVAKIASEHGVYLHVDAAYGGLIVPFLYEKGLLRDNVYFYPGVSSIAVDFHKFAAVPPPAGLILFSSDEYLDKSCFEYSYTLSGRTCGILGTRPGGSLAGIWAVVKAVGVERLRERALWAYRVAADLYERISSLRGFEVVKPQTTIVAFRHRWVDSLALLGHLAERGLFVYKAPSIRGLRVVVMPHFNEHLIGRFLDALDEVARTTPDA